MINEYDQIRKSLAKVRALQEETEMINLNQNKSDRYGEETTKSGDQITFDGINTTGYLNSQENINDDIKSALTTAVGEFIKATGLMLDTINIMVEDSRVIMKSETIKNPGSDSIKSVIFDTNKENPRIEVISGTIELSSDLVSMIQTTSDAYSDNQIGRNKLVSLTQNNL